MWSADDTRAYAAQDRPIRDGTHLPARKIAAGVSQAPSGERALAGPRATECQLAGRHAGRLTIETANGGVEAGGAAAGSHVRLTVHDAGHGLSPYVKAHLFEPSFMTKPIGQLTGLGLAMVHGIVTRSGGYVVVDSAPGTTIDIYCRARAS